MADADSDDVPAGDAVANDDSVDALADGGPADDVPADGGPAGDVPADDVSPDVAVAASDGDSTDADATASDDPPSEGTSGATAPLVFLFGSLLFIGGLVAFVVDVVTGHDVLRSLLVNAAGAFVLVAWAAQDTVRDPESAVVSRGGAAGTALLLYGVYLIAVGVVVAATSIWHDRIQLALLCGGSAIVAVAVGFVIFPTGAVVDGDDASGEEADDGTDSETDEQSGVAATGSSDDGDDGEPSDGS